MARLFLSHSSRDSREAVALRAWLIEAEPGLAGEIFLDLDPDTGIPAGVRWKDALRRAGDRCEAVICLLSNKVAFAASASAFFAALVASRSLVHFMKRVFIGPTSLVVNE